MQLQKPHKKTRTKKQLPGLKGSQADALTKLRKTIPDGLACGFVLDRGGERGVRLVFKQEGQRRLCRICSETWRQLAATGFFLFFVLPQPEKKRDVV